MLLLEFHFAPTCFTYSTAHLNKIRWFDSLNGLRIAKIKFFFLPPLESNRMQPILLSYEQFAKKITVPVSYMQLTGSVFFFFTNYIETVLRMTIRLVAINFVERGLKNINFNFLLCAVRGGWVEWSLIDSPVPLYLLHTSYLDRSLVLFINPSKTSG